MALVRTSPGTSSDSNTSRGYYYDVFLSFRGEDTRKTFTDHLYTALNNAGFLTFRDDDELERGEDIKPGLHKAIQLSRTSVVVFSKDYASSRCCLDELVLILERKRTSDHVVLPVFYDVDPSHVRKQTESIGKAFARHEKTQSPRKVKGWREALAEVADLAGMVLQNQAHGYESKFIKDIVKVISDKLSRTPLSIESKLIGIHSRVEDINLWLQHPSHDVGILVVYGIPGIGKTTIVKHVYNSNFRSFEGSSYVENIRETANQQNGLVQIQKQILYDIAKGKNEKIHNVSEGISKIERAISSRRVLIVLDDVDHMDQLDAVLRMKDRFYPGSKIIITTRRARLLKEHEGIKVRGVAPLSFDESLELLSWHAFGQDHPLEGYEEYSEEVVQHSGRLPLALKVLGSSLFREPKRVWKSTLEKLEVIPNGEIVNKLRISYDSLQDNHDQKLFLHIACFFVGKDEDYIVRILNGCDFYTIRGIQNLRDRCLVTIDMDKLSMHDVIRDMGREIVRRESDEPGNRSRLWHPKDSFEVLREKNGTQAIEGLILDMHKLLANIPRSSKETVLETNAFARMHKLKLLRLRHVLLDGCYGELPTGLRWLCWPEFPLDSIPVDFSLEKVVFLEMQYSSLRQVFKGSKFLPSLKILDVSHSHGLTEIMDFSLCPSLEELILVDCTSLIVVHESIGNLERLVCLNMMDCKNLGMLPKNMCMLKSLEKLILSGCSNLDVFGVEMMKKIESLKVLETDVIPLSELWPERCSSILSSLPCSLVELDLSECNLSEDAFPRDFSSLSSLRRLYLDNNPISSLPNCMRDLTRLDYLSFVRCTRLQSLVGLPKGCQLMNVSCCKSLEKVTYLLDQSFNWSPERHTIGGDTDNLVEWQYWYKLEPIGRVEVEMIRLLGLCNLESLPNVRMHKLDTIYWNDSDWTPVKGLHQYGIFSTFLPGNEFFRRNEVPGWLNRKSGGSSSISFTVPLLPDHRGLNIFAVYENYINCSDSEVVDDCIYDPMTIKVSNKSKGLKWIYGPLFYGVPEEGEEMTWLSHWKMENQTLGGGDEVEVSVIMRPQIGSEGDGFRLKDFVVKLVQGQQESNINTTADPFYPCVIGGNLSLWEYLPGIYFLCSLHPFYSENLHLCTLSRGWKNLIGDSDEGADNEEEQQDKDTEEKQQGDGAIVATRATGSNNFVGVCSSNNEEEKQDEDTGEVFGESFDFTPNIFKRKKKWKYEMSQ